MDDDSSLRAFSNEVFRLILSHADRGTLAVASRVCLAFLELAGPLLYTHIVIDREDQTRKLFCGQDRPPSLAIAPFLNLTQIRTFTILTDSIVGNWYQYDRLPPRRSLPVDHLELALDTVRPRDDRDLRTSQAMEDKLEYRKQRARFALLSLFDPVEFVVRYPHTDWTAVPRFHDRLLKISAATTSVLVWMRLRRVLYIGGSLHYVGSYGTAAPFAWNFAKEPITITVDLGRFVDKDGHPVDPACFSLENELGNRVIRTTGGLFDGLFPVILVLPGEAAREDAAAWIKAHHTPLVASLVSLVVRATVE